MINLVCPSLRERKEDIPALVNHMLAAIEHPEINSTDSDDTKTSSFNFTDAAMGSLQSYDFPGNVRELENILERTTAIASTSLLDTADLQIKSLSLQDNVETATNLTDTSNSASSNHQTESEKPIRSFNAVNASQDNDSDPTKSAEREQIKAALDAHRWNRKATAKALGLTYRQLRYRIEQLDLNED